MSENTICISVSEYDRLLQIERESKPIHSRITPASTPPLQIFRPVTFLQGPHQRGVVCRNCGMDLWLVDDFNDPMCGSCGLYVESGVKVVTVAPPEPAHQEIKTVEAPDTLKPCSVCGCVSWMVAPNGKYECVVCKQRRDNPLHILHVAGPK